MEKGERRMEKGEWRIENGEWKKGEWRMRNGEWRMENGEWLNGQMAKWPHGQCDMVNVTWATQKKIPNHQFHMASSVWPMPHD